MNDPVKVGTSCCRAYQASFPSGLWWIHSRYCPLKPGEKIRKVGEVGDRGAPDESPPVAVRPIPVTSPTADADSWGEFWGDL